MHQYQLKLVLNENKIDEFEKTLLSLLGGFRQEKGCLDYNFLQDIERVKTYVVAAEWKTRQAMENHFKGKEFSVLVGAARVLGKTFELRINKITEKGDFQLAKDKISMPKQHTQADL